LRCSELQSVCFHSTLLLVGALIVWPIIGFILGFARGRLLPTFVLTIHTVAVGSIMMRATAFETASEQWTYLAQAQRHVGAAITTGFVVYLIGQLAAWFFILRRSGTPDLAGFSRLSLTPY
jgi:hypothetical protein